MKEPRLSSIAYVARDYVDQPKAVMVNFHGLGHTEMRSVLDMKETEWAAKGVLFIYPFTNPWSWMNERTVKLVDDILDRVEREYSTQGLPLIARGGSMGGYSALAYSMFSRKPVAGCIAVAPVCDIVYHYTERPDLPRTFHDAFDNYSDITALLEARSPVQQVSRLPDIEYLIIHGFKDPAVSKKFHSDVLVQRMKQRGLRVRYVEDSKMDHAWPFEHASILALNEFVEKMINR